MAKRTKAIWGSLDFTSNVRGLGLCALILMLALPLKSYAVDPSLLGLDAIANFAVYAQGSLTITGTTTVTGDVGLGPNGTQNFGTAFTINGTNRVDNTANNSHTYNGVNFTGGTVLQNLQYVSTTVSSVSANASSLTPTLTLSSILTTNYTLVGNGGYNVISLPGISYTGGSRVLTLQGGANDVFIINVGNNNLSFASFGATPIALSGVATNHVLFNLLSTSAGANALNVSQANETLIGTFIAPFASINVVSDKISGGVFAGGNTLSLNSSTINANVFALPEPSSFALVGIACLFGLGVWSRGRIRR